MQGQYITGRPRPSTGKITIGGTTQQDRLDTMDRAVEFEYTPRKKQAVQTADYLTATGRTGRGERCSHCGSLLAFAWDGAEPGDGSARLVKANFCRDRVCPHCQRRRSLKLYGQMRSVLSYLNASERCRFLFLTLTVPNCTAEELPGTITKMMAGWNRFANYARVKGAVLGYFRALEVTLNRDPTSKSFGTYHPHFHAVTAVPASYFHGPLYIRRSEWLDLWRRAMRDPSIVAVDVRAFRDLPGPGDDPDTIVSYTAAVAEATKYALKPADLLADLDSFDTFATALSGRRLIAWGGILKKAHAELGFEDVEGPDADLANDDNPHLPRPSGRKWVTVYLWNASRYCRHSSRLVDLDSPDDPLSPASRSPAGDPGRARREWGRAWLHRRIWPRIEKSLNEGPGVVPGPERSSSDARTDDHLVAPVAPQPVQLPLQDSPSN